MHKLLRRALAAAPISFGNTPLSLPVSSSSFLSLGFGGGPLGISKKILCLRQPNPLHQSIIKPVSYDVGRGLKLMKLTSSGYCPCSCVVDNGSYTVSSRAWVVLKENNKYGGFGGGSHRAAWFCTLAGNLNNGGEFAVAKGGSEESGLAKGAEEKRLQRMMSGGGGSGAVVVVSPDLLIILGVGPRNLNNYESKPNSISMNWVYVI